MAPPKPRGNEKADTSAKETESLFRDAVTLLPIGIYVTDRDGKCLYVNDCWCEQAGISFDDALGEGWVRGIHREDRGRVRSAWDRHVHHGQSWDLEYRLGASDRTVRWVLGRATPRRDAAGNVIGYIGVNTDITGRKRAEEELASSERNFRFVLDNSIDAICKYNLGAKSFEYFSPSSVRIFGYTPEEMIEMGVRGYVARVHPDDYAGMREHMENLLAGALEEDYSPILEYRFEHKQLGYRWIKDTRSLIRDAEGVPMAIIGNEADITDRKQIELELLRYAEITSNSADMLALLDGNYVYLTANAAFLNALNLTAAQTIGHAASEILGEEFFKANLKPHGDRCLAGVPVNYETWFDFPGKGRRFLDINCSPYIDSDGEVMGIVASARDISGRKVAELELQESERRLRRFFGQGLIGMAMTSVDKRWVEFNDVLCNMFGYSRDVFAKLTWDELTHPDDLEADNAQFDRVVAGEIEGYSLDKRFFRKDGSVLYASIAANVVREVDGSVDYFSALVSDVTERKRAEEELRTLERAVESSSSAVVITDVNGNIEYVNPQFTETTGYAKEEVVGKNPRFQQSGETPDVVYVEMWEKLLTDGEWRGEFHNKKKDGTPYWSRATISCVKDIKGDITHFIGVQDDVTREYELTERLSYQARHDTLTGLVNRREFERRAERLFGVGPDPGEHALCYMDLDQFKLVNDTCGHVAGDELLRQLGSVLQGVVRYRDTLARLGGGEFGVLMEHCSLDDAHRVAGSLQKAIQDYQFNWEGRAFRVGVSIGLVAITAATANLTELLKAADAACYMAKDLGRDRIHVYLPDDAELAARHGEMQWVVRLQQALEEDRFCLYAQAIAPLDGSDSKHYEVLLRMVNEQGEIVLPGAFLPAAERYGVISQLDRWVIEKTFGVLADNPAFLERIDFISINLSGHSLADDGCYDFVVARLAAQDIPPGKVCFEITETAAITNLSTANTLISKTGALGCRFALDDFGSGLSSFAYLKNLPVDYLKIDGMFVKDMVDDPIDRAMVKSINEIGQVMGMETIAEFVENDEIKGMLREIGVNYAQGDGIDKPMAVSELFGGFDAENPGAS